MIRRLAAALAALSLSAVLAAPMSAGGWAEVRVDPQGSTGEPVAGTPFVVAFAVLQHGRTPAGWVTPTVRFSHLGTTTTIDVPATPVEAGGSDGRFRATVTLDPAGYWSWTVSFPELMSDQVPITLAVRTADGLVPGFEAADATLVIDDLNARLVAEVARLETRLADLQVRADTTDRELGRLATATDGGRASPAPDDGELSVAGVVLLAILAGASAGFAMSWLAGRSAPREIDVAFSPAPRGVDRA